MDFFEVPCGTGFLSFSLFPERFLRFLTEVRLCDERRALGEDCLLLTDFENSFGLTLGGVFLPFSTFMSEVLERCRDDDGRDLVRVLFLIAVLLNYQHSGFRAVFQLMFR
jgi:hypothetical protein